MSGPVETKDVEQSPDDIQAANRPVLSISDSRLTNVGVMAVRRALPNRARRTVGAWCFVDHAGPVTLDADVRPDIGPHPHMGLHTVTWVLEGEMLHRDSLGSEQIIRPGQLNLMTAGHGISHAEEATGGPGSTVHLVQLWVAQPASTREGPPAFEHHAELPKLSLDRADATVLIGRMGSAASPARRDTEMVGVDLSLRAGVTEVPLAASFEHALVILTGAVAVEGEVATPGHLLYLGAGRNELGLTADEPARLLLLGGLPFPEQLLMWWNLVARTKEEVEAAYTDWATDSGRFGRVKTSLSRVETNPPLWMPPSS